MGMLDNIKPHEVVADLFRYKITFAGRPKSGKTSAVYKIAMQEFDGDLSKMLLIATERGYNALRGIHAVDVQTWEEILELKDELIEGKDKVSFKVLAFDTVDELEKLATTYIIKKARRQDKKNYSTIGDIPWGNGYNMLEDEVSTLLNDLDMAGYTLWFVTHDKDKKFETKDGLSYDKTILSVGGRVGDIVKNTSDFIVFIELTKEADDEGNIVDKRYIHLRGDGSLEAGGRFENLPNKIEYDIPNFISTLKDAIMKDGFDGDEDAMKEALERQSVEFEEKVERVSGEKQLSDLHEELGDILGKLSATNKKKVAVDMKKILGTLKYREVESQEEIESFINHVQENYA